MNRSNVRYWVKLYESGKFDPSVGISNKRSKMSYVVLDRDISVVTDYIKSEPDSSSSNVHKILHENGANFSLGTTKNVIKASGFEAAKPTEVPLVTL